MNIWNWLLTVTGSNDTTGTYYGFWSGFGSCLTYFGIFAVLYRKYNCHINSCHRIGLHKVKNTPYVLCRKHHPETPSKTVTQDHVNKLHKLRSK